MLQGNVEFDILFYCFQLKASLKMVTEEKELLSIKYKTEAEGRKDQQGNTVMILLSVTDDQVF